MAYADVADLKKRHRSSEIRDLLVSEPGGARPTDAELDDDPILESLLEQASGKIKAALRQGERYSADDLDGLTGPDLELLKGLTCDLAWAALLIRGGSPKTAEEFAKPALETLELLRNGTNVFDLAPQTEAGLPDSSLPSVQAVTNANDIESRTPHYFAGSYQRRPLDQR